MDLVWSFAGVPRGEDGIKRETAGPGQLFFVWMTGAFGLGIPSVCAGDLFWKFVDRPCVDLARWLQLLPFQALAKHASATVTQLNATVLDFHEHSYPDQALLTDLNSSATSSSCRALL